MARRKPKAKATMGEAQSMESLISLFEGLEDPRVERTRDYSLAEILFLVLSAVISGVNFLTEVEKFGEAKIEWLRSILPYENGVPSHDTIGRVLGMLDPDELERMFVSWTTAVAEQVDGVVAIDGKAVRRAIARGNKRSFVHMVSAFMSANSLVIGQVKVDEKSNEITAIPRLLKLLHLQGAIVTIDAAGCQETIANEIVERGGQFVLAVKNNQRTLFEDVDIAFHDVDIRGKQAFASQTETEELSHGRGEYRRCEVLHADEHLTHRDKWPHIKTLVRVTSERRGVRQELEAHTRLFVSSIEGLNAAEALRITRAHWSVENKLHWILDVAFREDECRVYAANAAENLVVFRHIALNLLRSVKSLSGGIASKRNQAAWTDSAREAVLSASLG
ncbi:MAG: ISAs1 family transposase [Roseibacillus sp.]|nr:ISAs1 family transposase [Roseibacillus sp.]